MKILNLDIQRSPFRETWLWTPACTSFSRLTFTPNKDIFFHGIGFLGRTINNLTIPTSENFTIVLENCDFFKVLEESVCIEQDGTSKVYELLLSKPFLIKAGEVYSVQLFRQEDEAEHFTTSYSKCKYNSDGVKFEFETTGYSFITAFFFEKTGSTCECVLC